MTRNMIARCFFVPCSFCSVISWMLNSKKYKTKKHDAGERIGSLSHFVVVMTWSISLVYVGWSKTTFFGECFRTAYWALLWNNRWIRWIIAFPRLYRIITIFCGLNPCIDFACGYLKCNMLHSMLHSFFYYSSSGNATTAFNTIDYEI